MGAAPQTKQAMRDGTRTRVEATPKSHRSGTVTVICARPAISSSIVAAWSCSAFCASTTSLGMVCRVRATNDTAGRRSTGSFLSNVRGTVNEACSSADTSLDVLSFVGIKSMLSITSAA